MLHAFYTHCVHTGRKSHTELSSHNPTRTEGQAEGNEIPDVRRDRS